MLQAQSPLWQPPVLDPSRGSPLAQQLLQGTTRQRSNSVDTSSAAPAGPRSLRTSILAAREPSYSLSYSQDIAVDAPLLARHQRAPSIALEAIDRASSMGSQLGIPHVAWGRPSIVRAVRTSTSQVDEVTALQHVPTSRSCALSTPTGHSLILFGPDSWLRQAAAAVISHRHFESVILTLIVLSSIALALDAPSLDDGSTLKQALNILDWIFVVAFLLEALLKVLVMGFVANGPDSYLRNAWNVLDFVIMVVGLVTVVTEAVQGPEATRQLMAIRCVQGCVFAVLATTDDLRYEHSTPGVNRCSSVVT